MSELERIDDVVLNQLELFDRAQAVLRSRQRNSRANLSFLTGCEACEDSQTQQQFKVECDVNTIVERFGITGQAPIVNSGGLYGDFTGLSEFEGVLELHERVKEMFEALPPELRETFDNDPLTLAAFASSRTPEEFDEFLQDYVTVEAPGAPSVAPEPGNPAAEPVVEDKGA